MDDRSPTAILLPPGVFIVGDLNSARVEAYWHAVSETLRTVLGKADSVSLVASARDRLERATIETQRIFYHASPFQVASDLAGMEGTWLEERQLSRYREIIVAFDPTLYPSPS